MSMSMRMRRHRAVTDGGGNQDTEPAEPRPSSYVGTPSEQHGRICRQMQERGPARGSAGAHRCPEPYRTILHIKAALHMRAS